MRIHQFPLALGACAVLSLAAFAAAPASAPKIGGPAPTFTLNDSQGNPVSLADLKGKIVVLEWINRDCPIDRRVIESKFISTVYDRFKDQVAWFAVDSAAAHTKADYDKTIADFKLTYPVLNDAKGVVGRLYNAATTPHFFIINSDGKLAYIGTIDDDPNGTKPARVNYVDKALSELVAGKTVTLPETKPYGCSVKY